MKPRGVHHKGCIALRLSPDCDRRPMKSNPTPNLFTEAVRKILSAPKARVDAKTKTSWSGFSTSCQGSDTVLAQARGGRFFGESTDGKTALSSTERRTYYDTTASSHGNGGHLFPDEELNADEKIAVMEYLKTL